MTSTSSEFNLVPVPKMAMMFLVIITAYESLPYTQYNFPCGNSFKLLSVNYTFFRSLIFFKGGVSSVILVGTRLLEVHILDVYIWS